MKEILQTIIYLDRRKNFHFNKKEIDFLIKLNKDLFNHIDNKLNKEFAYGFNLHGKDHIRSVFKNVLFFYQEIKNKINNKTLALSILYHDIGNLIERKNHHLYSKIILEEIFKIYNLKNLEEEKIITSVYFHELEGLKDSPLKLKMFNDFFKNNKLEFRSLKNFEKQINKLNRLLPEESKLLFIADNLDIGPHRLPIKKFKSQNFFITEKDIHIFINSLWRFEKAFFFRNELILLFKFNPYLKKSIIKNKTLHRLIFKGKRIYFPDWAYKIYKDYNLSFFDISLASLFKLYKELIYVFFLLNKIFKKDIKLKFLDEKGFFERVINLKKEEFSKNIYYGFILPFRLHKI